MVKVDGKPFTLASARALELARHRIGAEEVRAEAARLLERVMRGEFVKLGPGKLHPMDDRLENRKQYAERCEAWCQHCDAVGETARIARRLAKANRSIRVQTFMDDIHTCELWVWHCDTMVPAAALPKAA